MLFLNYVMMEFALRASIIPYKHRILLAVYKHNVSSEPEFDVRKIAAFIAADANEAVGMKHIKGAAYSEYMKLERQLTDIEVRGWE